MGPICWLVLDWPSPEIVPKTDGVQIFYQCRLSKNSLFMYLIHHDFSTLFIERMTFLHAPWSSHVSLKDLIKARSKVHTISILLILGNLCILLRRWEILFVIISSKIFIVVYIRDVSSRTPCTKIYLQPQQGYLEFPKLLQITGQK